MYALMQSHDHLTGLSNPVAPRLSLATYLRHERVSIAKKLMCEIALRCPTFDTRAELFACTLVDAAARMVEDADPDVLANWALVVRNVQPVEVVHAGISAICAAIESAEDGHHCDSSLLVFLEAAKVRVMETLGATGENVAQDRPMINAMLVLLRARDESTCTHSQATGAWCRRLCEELGLGPSQSEVIARAGVLHDVGKIATPDAILLKNGPLTAHEWETMKQHAPFGAELLLDVPTLAPYAPIVRSHHERIDGRGYPDGLAGDDIPFEARVVAVADAFHAMISDRPYRAALSVSRALSELRAGRGTQWEADVVDAMVRVVASNRAQAVSSTFPQGEVSGFGAATERLES